MSDRMKQVGRMVRLATLFSLTALAGCFSLARTETPQRQYVLGGSEMQANAASPAGLTGVTVGIRRLRLAPYLNSPHVAVRHGPHEIRSSDFHKWGEPLDGGINRVVAAYLGAGADFGAVDVAPWPARGGHQFLIQLHVERFEGIVADTSSATGEVHMLVAWQILRQRDELELARGVSEHREPAWTVGDYSALVRGLDAGLATVSQDLLRSLSGLASAATSTSNAQQPAARGAPN